MTFSNTLAIYVKTEMALLFVKALESLALHIDTTQANLISERNTPDRNEKLIRNVNGSIKLSTHFFLTIHVVGNSSCPAIEFFKDYICYLYT